MLVVSFSKPLPHTFPATPPHMPGTDVLPGSGSVESLVGAKLLRRLLRISARVGVGLYLRPEVLPFSSISRFTFLAHGVVYAPSNFIYSPFSVCHTVTHLVIYS